MIAALAVLAGALGFGITAQPAAALPPFEAHPSVNQVYTFGHPVGSTVELLDASSNVVASGTADAQGAFLFVDITAGAGYQVREGGQSVTGLDVMAPDVNPAPSFYSGIDLGGLPATNEKNRFVYIPTRDGTLLSANIVFPKDGSKGPWPVLVEYSGYDPSQPPNTPAESQMFPFAGYIVVGVNLRGTTCSGGALRVFEYLEALDGYDVIEALAAQKFSNGNVGMVGVSFSGITQLFVGQTRPPHLAALSPLSTYADFYRGIGYPGGIINDGFFMNWIAQRDADSQPAAHQWVKDRITNGDTTCAANQVMHGQASLLVPQALPDRLYETRGDPLSPYTFVDRITAPTFLEGALQDEQTGGQWSVMVPHFDPATKLKVQITNGTHVEGFGPEHLQRLMEFIDFYVGKKIPHVPATVRLGAPLIFKDLFGTDNAGLPFNRFDKYPDYASALAAYEAEPKVHVYWENGAGRNPGEPFSTFQADYASWPLPGTTSQAYYFAPDGRLDASGPPGVADSEPRGASGYAYDPASKLPRNDYSGSTADIWKAGAINDVNWRENVEGTALSFVTDPFTQKTTFAGWGSADLWVRSTEADTDLEVTLSEVRPDGKETFIQSGWLRASRRKVDDTQSTDLFPFHSHLAADVQPLPAGQFSLARVPIFPMAHVIRPGSRLRVTVEAPGGDQPFWVVDPMKFDHAVTNDIGHSLGRPSRIVLPLVPTNLNPKVPDTLPPCPALRNQPCRAYLPARIPTAVSAQVSGADLAVTWSPPPGPDVPSGYRITVQPTGETFDVGAGVTSFTYPNAAFDTPFTFTVTALFGEGSGPASDASLAATIQSPTTTTTTAAPTTTTTAPGATTTTIAGVSGNGIQPGTLPSTGFELIRWVSTALLLLGVGTLLVAIALRRRATD